MKSRACLIGSLFAAGLFTPALAFAQNPPPAAPAPAPAPAAPAAAPAPAEAAPAPAPEPAPAPAPAAETPPPTTEAAPAAEPAAATPATPPPPAPEAPAAEEAKPAPTVSGYIEAAYHGNITRLDNSTPVLFRAYDQHANSFYLHAAHVAINHSFNDDVSGTIELDLGSDAAIDNYAYAAGLPFAPIAAGIPFDVQEAYGVWSPGDVTFTAGKFVTYEGIEVIEGPVNPTLTRGFLFWMAEPITHTGAKVAYNIMDKASIAVGLVNGWDVLLDNNDAKTFIFAAAVTPVDQFRAQVSGTYGSEQANIDDNPRLSLDLTGAVILDPVTINFQANYGSESNALDSDGDGVTDQDDSWFGVGLQPVLTLDKFVLGARWELFTNKHGSRAFVPGVDAMGNPITAPLDDTSLMNFTITPGYYLAEGFLARAELRLDTSSHAVFPNSDDPPTLKKSQVTFGVGASYSF